MKRLILLISTVIILLGVTPLMAEEYKSMCELHPEECAEGSLCKLGEVVEQSDGKKYRVIAEAKSTIDPVWVQLIDYASIGEKFDGKCKFAVFFMLKSNGFYGDPIHCWEAISMMKNQCKTEGIKYDDYVHKAPDLSNEKQ